jgi:hypothetical protein
MTAVAYRRVLAVTVTTPALLSTTTSLGAATALKCRTGREAELPGGGRVKSHPTRAKAGTRSRPEFIRAAVHVVIEVPQRQRDVQAVRKTSISYKKIK